MGRIHDGAGNDAVREAAIEEEDVEARASIVTGGRDESDAGLEVDGGGTDAGLEAEGDADPDVDGDTGPASRKRLSELQIRNRARRDHLRAGCRRLHLPPLLAGTGKKRSIRFERSKGTRPTKHS